MNSFTPSPKKQISLSYVRLLTIAFSIGLSLGAGLATGITQALNQTASQTQSTQLTTRPLRQAEYERLQPGMTLTEVEAILDRGTEISRTATTATFLWRNPDGSQIKVSFEHNQLKSKEQANLN